MERRVVMIEKNLIKLDLDYETRADVITRLGQLLHEKDYVKEEFIQAVLDREEKHPTGIPAEPAIALPHTSSDLVKRAAIAVAILDKPVEFYQMGGSGERLNVKIVFMLAIDDPEKHLNYLQRIMDILEDDEALKKLENSTTVEDAYKVLSYINS